MHEGGLCRMHWRSYHISSVDTSVYTVYTLVYKGVYVCTLTCLAKFNLKVL